MLLIARMYAGLGFALTEGTSSPRRLDKPQPMVGIVDWDGIAVFRYCEVTATGELGLYRYL